MWHYCATPIWPCPLFLWSWLCTFAGNRLAYISPVTSSKSNPGQITCECVRACLRVHVCGKGEGLGSARSSSERFAQHIACHCPIWKKFHASHVIPLKLRCVSWRLGWLVEVSFFRSDKIFLCVCFGTCNCSRLKLNCPPNEGGLVKRRPVWMNEHVPADGGRSSGRERSGLLFSPAQRWLWGHRGQHDPCDPHVTPLLQPQLLKVRKQLGFAKISRNENTRVPAPKKNTFLFIDSNTYVFRFANS